MKRYLVLLGVLLALPAYGEEPPADLDEIVVTATRTEKSVEDAPGSVSVVTSAEMKKRNIQSLDEALNLLPGVLDNHMKGLRGTNSTVTFRGLSGAGRSLLLLDGMPLNDAYAASQPWDGLFPQNFSRIEVVRGPSSSLYGGNAMGGVINFMSSMPEKREVTLSGGFGDRLGSDTGLANLWSAYASYGDRIGNFRLYAAFGYRTTRGYPTALVTAAGAPTEASGITGAIPTSSTTGDVKYLVGDTGDNGWWDYSAAVRAQYDISDTATVRFSWLRTANKYFYEDPHTFLRNADGDPVYTYANASGKAVITESTFLNGNGSKVMDTCTIHAEALLGTVKGKFLFGVNDQNVNWYLTPSAATLAGGKGTKSDSPGRTYYTDIQASLPVMDRHILTGGFTFRYDTADSNNFPVNDYRDPDSVSGASTQWGGGTSQTYSVYLQGEIALLDTLTLYAGLRDDVWVSSDGYAGFTGTGATSETYPHKTKNSVNPKGALVWRPLDGTTLRVSGGKAFRAPPLNQLYKTWMSSSTLTIYNANPDLDPETVLGWDIGAEQALWKGAKIKATFFENYLSHMIYNVTQPGTTTIDGKEYKNKKYTNVGGAETRGVELEVEQKVGENLRLFAGYTYTDSEITEYDPDPSLVGKQLTQAPRNMFFVGADASWGPASLFVSGRYVGKRLNSDDNSDTVNNVYGSYDPYFVVDMKAAYRVTDWATVSFSVNNLLDREYYTYYVAPGRSFFANLDLKF
jgi:iron complex outermembrane receptor protein